MVYFDWNKAEETRIEARIEKDIEVNMRRRTRGAGHIWAQVEKDIEEQERLYRNQYYTSLRDRYNV